jgi:hypothetical protein
MESSLSGQVNSPVAMLWSLSKLDASQVGRNFGSLMSFNAAESANPWVRT